MSLLHNHTESQTCHKPTGVISISVTVHNHTESHTCNYTDRKCLVSSLSMKFNSDDGYFDVKLPEDLVVK